MFLQAIPFQNQSCIVFFKKPRGINYKEYNSKQWQPDECFINEQNKFAYIIDKKFQNSSGIVDEKLLGCHLKNGI